MRRRSVAWSKPVSSSGFLEPEITIESRPDNAPVDEARARLIARSAVARHMQKLRRGLWAIAAGVIVVVFTAGMYWSSYGALRSDVDKLKKASVARVKLDGKLELLLPYLQSGARPQPHRRPPPPRGPPP